MVAACAPTRLTPTTLQPDLAGSFARLYVLQQSEQGRRPPDLRALATTAACQRGTPADRQSGAGAWTCQVTFLVDGPATPVRALYELDVHPDGCWSATGDGPQAVNGARTIIDASGRQRPNPLAVVFGCLDPG